MEFDKEAGMEFDKGAAASVGESYRRNLLQGNTSK